MFRELLQHPTALLLSILGHAVIVGVLVFSLKQQSTPVMQASVEPVKALAVDEALVDKARKDLEEQEKLRKKKLSEAEKKRKQAEAKRKQAERKRKEEEQRLKKVEQQLAKEKEKQKVEAARQAKLKKEREAAATAKAAEAKKKAAAKEKAEKERLAALERQRKMEQERKRREAEEQKAREAELQRALEAERQAEEARERALAQKKAEEERLQRENVRLNRQRAEYKAAIRQKVERNWIRPSTAGSGVSCEVFVEQDPGGGVMSVQVRRCEGDQAFRHSVETAVKRASPLPTPADPALFDRNIEFMFKPEG
jgi:colicin import membrane protein